MDETYNHPSIQLYIMGLKPQVGRGSKENPSNEIEQKINENDPKCNESKSPEAEASEIIEPKNKDVNDDKFVEEKIKDGESEIRVPKGKLSEWEARRYGSEAARLLQDIKINTSHN